MNLAPLIALTCMLAWGPALVTEWKLDNLGNWSGTPDASVSLKIGSQAEHELHHDVDRRNRVTALIDDGVETPFINDAAGKLVSDGPYVYQYDAWGHLLQINKSSNATFDADGRIHEGKLADLVARYAYDGLGRLIRKETPLTRGDETSLQLKNFYYDGVRRIQEEIFRPDVAELGLHESLVEVEPTGEYVPVTMTENDEAAKLPDLDGDGIPDEIDVEQDIIKIEATQLSGLSWVDREYIYGPDYVDEFVCQIGPDNRAVFMLQDANFNVVATVDDQGRVTEQYGYDPYGTIATRDEIESAVPTEQALNRVGHQGLFFDRLDGKPNAPILEPGATGLYFNRNRWYSPTLGRFLQPDPNETSLPIVTALMMNAQSASLAFDAFNAMGLYGDGMNLFLYEGGNPIRGRDPNGLDDFEDAMMDVFADRIAAIGALMDRVGRAFDTAVFIGQIAMTFVPGADVAGAAYDMFTGNGSLTGLLAASAMEFGGPLADFGRVGAKLLGKANKVRSRYARAGRFVARGFDEAWHLVQRSWKGGKGLTKYHWEKHAKHLGLSLEEYTDDAIKFWNRNRHSAREFPIDGGMGTGFKIEGAPGGIFTADGKIVTFWYD